MRQVARWSGALLVFLLSLPVAYPQAPRTPDSPVTSWRKLDAPMNDNCSLCHQRLGETLSRQVAEWQGSVHAANGIFCDSCHGGDPTSLVNTIAMGEAQGFREAPLPPAIPEDCSRCHQDALVSFKESAHGELFESNDYEPGCVTCHNSHNVSEVSLNMVSLEAACGECHNEDYINEVRIPLQDTDQKIAGLYTRLASMPAGNPNGAYLKARLDRTKKEFRRLAHYLTSNTIAAKRQSIDRELDHIEFMIALENFQPGR